jgi:hypothetical protein
MRQAYMVLLHLILLAAALLVSVGGVDVGCTHRPISTGRMFEQRVESAVVAVLRSLTLICQCL